MKFKAIAIVGLLISTPAFAQDKEKEDTPQLRELINCFPAKGIAEFVSKFQTLDGDKRDTVDMLFDANFRVKDGGDMPTRMFLRDKGVEENFTLGADGNISDFDKIGKSSEEVEICSEDPSRVGIPSGSGDMSFSITNDVHFLENSGYHDLATIKDGLKDGKSHYKKMAPAAMRFLVPKLSYVMIEYDDDKTSPQYMAMTGQTPIEGLEHATFCDNAMIKIKDLEALDADGLKVMGGSYRLTPVPGPKTLAKFAGCVEDEDGEGNEGEDKEE